VGSLLWRMLELFSRHLPGPGWPTSVHLLPAELRITFRSQFILPMHLPRWVHLGERSMSRLGSSFALLWLHLLHPLLLLLVTPCPISYFQNATYPVTLPGQSVSGTCDTGLQGTATRACLTNGTWSNTIKNPCQKPGSIHFFFFFFFTLLFSSNSFEYSVTCLHLFPQLS